LCPTRAPRLKPARVANRRNIEPGGPRTGALGGIRTPDPQIRSYVLSLFLSPWP